MRRPKPKDTWQDFQQRVDAEVTRRNRVRAAQKQEAAMLAKLKADADSWDQARRIRCYIAALADHGGSFPDSLARERWLSWARDQADRIDPLTPSPSSILDEVLPPVGDIHEWEEIADQLD